MTRVFWLTLDWLGHRIPFLRFGRVRHAICCKAIEQWEIRNREGRT